MAEKENLPFLGSLPVDTELVTLLDAAETSDRTLEATEDGAMNEEEPFPLLRKYKKTSSWPLFKAVVERAVSNIALTDTSPS